MHPAQSNAVQEKLQPYLTPAKASNHYIMQQHLIFRLVCKPNKAELLNNYEGQVHQSDNTGESIPEAKTPNTTLTPST